MNHIFYLLDFLELGGGVFNNARNPSSNLMPLRFGSLISGRFFFLGDFLFTDSLSSPRFMFDMFLYQPINLPVQTIDSNGLPIRQAFAFGQVNRFHHALSITHCAGIPEKSKLIGILRKMFAGIWATLCVIRPSTTSAAATDLIQHRSVTRTPSGGDFSRRIGIP